jgi:hypothetical protein
LGRSGGARGQKTPERQGSSNSVHNVTSVLSDIRMRQIAFESGLKLRGSNCEAFRGHYTLLTTTP